jgi:putative flippase GtrA
MADFGMPTLRVGTPPPTGVPGVGVPGVIAPAGRSGGFVDRAAGTVRMARFALVGATGTVVNLAVMAALLAAGSHYVLAAIVAAEVSIIGNFLLQERFVFQDRRGASSLRRRFVQAVTFNNLEALARLPLLVLLVELLALPEIVAQASTLAAAFLLRFTFMSRVVYRASMTSGR